MTGSLTSRVSIKAAGRTLSTPACTEGDLLCSALPTPPRRGAIYARLAHLLRESSAAVSRETYYAYSGSGLKLLELGLKLGEKMRKSAKGQNKAKKGENGPSRP
jgi:hypothetical protein